MIEAREARALERLAATYAADHGVPGLAAGVVIGDRLAWSAGVGVTRLDGGGRPDERTQYRIASITKTFTSTAIVQLRDAGRLALDDPLVHHIPEFAAVGNPFGPVELVTLRHVLQHTSGLQGEAPNRDLRDWSRLDTPGILAALGEVAVVIAPGTRHKYSNLGYHLLGEVVARASGRPYWDYLREEILDPLGMPATTPAPEGDVATGHRGRGFDEWPVAEAPGDPDSDGGQGAGGLWSTVADLAAWVGLQLRADGGRERGPGQVLAGASLRELHRATVVTDYQTATRSLGWFRVRDGETERVAHEGELAGFSSTAAFCPADRIGAIVLSNRSVLDVATLAQKLLDAVRPLARREADLPAVAPAPPPAGHELLGEYWARGGWARGRVVARDGHLAYVAEPADIEIPLEPTAEPLRFIAGGGRAVGEAVRFFRARDGAIEGLNLAGFPLFRLRSPAG